MRPLYTGEQRVEMYRGVRLGDRVKLSAAWLAQLSRAGIAAEGIKKRATPGVVKEIVIHRVHGWDSMRIQHDNGYESWQAAGDLRHV